MNTAKSIIAVILIVSFNIIPIHSFSSEDTDQRINQLEQRVKHLEELIESAKSKPFGLSLFSRTDSADNKESTTHNVAVKPVIDSSLIYSDDNIRAELISAEIEITNHYLTGISKNTKISLKVDVINKSKFIRPITYNSFTDDTTGKYIEYPTNFELRDNFKNELKLWKIKPNYQDFSRSVLRYEDDPIQFTIWFINYPLIESKYLILTVNKDTFGNTNKITFNIPIDLVVEVKK